MRSQGDEEDYNGCGNRRLHERRRFNLPNRSTINYRLDVHGGFLQRMQDKLHLVGSDFSGAGSHPLRRLNAGSTGDPAIAMLDAWATVADVLSFYQERIANEGFLRTATERSSILELARLIGYELAPGAAAETQPSPEKLKSTDAVIYRIY
jgi:hypothetical protein